MSNEKIWVDIVIPLISAFIGGFVTMLGVILTLRHEKKRENDNVKQSVKPWIYSLDFSENYDCKNTNDIYLAESENFRTHLNTVFVIKNTDNGICIIEKFETKDSTYYPVLGNILDKNSVTNLYICFQDKKESLQDMCLYIKDVYGNQYKYKAFIGGLSKSNYIEELSEV